MSVEELRAERRRLKIPEDGSVEGRSISDLADDVPAAPDDDFPDELFAFEHGRKVPISKLIDRNVPIEYEMNLNSKSFKGGDSMGLLAFSNPDLTLVVPVRQGKVVVDPTYDNDTGLVLKVVVRANFRPLAAHDVASREGQELLGGFR